MTIFTSYYANIKNIPDDYVLISISGTIDQGIKDAIDTRDLRFAPSKSIFFEYKNSHEGKEREDLYVKRFKAEILDKFNFKEIEKEYLENYQDKNVVLLCYEKPEDFCHRQIVAEWFEENGYPVQELGVQNSIRKDYKYQRESSKDLGLFF